MPLSSRLSAAAVLCLIFVGVAHPAFADEVSTCNPHQGTSGTSCIGQPCATLGMSEMDGDKASIIVCLQTSGSNSALVWKNQTPPPSNNGTISFPYNGHIYTVPAQILCVYPAEGPSVVVSVPFLGDATPSGAISYAGTFGVSYTFSGTLLNPDTPTTCPASIPVQVQ